MYALHYTYFVKKFHNISNVLNSITLVLLTCYIVPSLKSCGFPQWHSQLVTQCVYTPKTQHTTMFIWVETIQEPLVTSFRQLNFHYVLAFLFISMFNSLEPSKYGSSFESAIFKLIILTSSLGILCEIALRSRPRNFTNEKLTSKYLSQCWPRSLSPYDVTRPQWVNQLGHLTLHPSSRQPWHWKPPFVWAGVSGLTPFHIPHQMG